MCVRKSLNEYDWDKMHRNKEGEWMKEEFEKME